METVSGFTRIALPGSTMKRGEKVNVFWLDQAGGILFDVGWATDESFAALQAALPRPPRHVLITHMHPDHGGAIARVRAWTDGAIWAPHEDAAVTDHPFPADTRFFDREQPVDLGGVRVAVMHTPGHTPGHRCFHVLDAGALITGDMVLGEGSTWVGPPHGDMAQYMHSLERMRRAGHRVLLPGHGPIQTDPLAKIKEFLEHRLMRERQVIEALAAGHDTPPAIVARNYADTPVYLHPLAQVVVRAHLKKLVDEGRVLALPDDRFQTR